jgi:hypothetical protein
MTGRRISAAALARCELGFRDMVRGLAPGTLVEWRDMDDFVSRNFSEYEYEFAQSDLTIKCMTEAMDLADRGILLAYLYPGYHESCGPSHPNGVPDHYFRRGANDAATAALVVAAVAASRERFAREQRERDADSLM